MDPNKNCCCSSRCPMSRDELEKIKSELVSTAIIMSLFLFLSLVVGISLLFMCNSEYENLSQFFRPTSVAVYEIIVCLGIVSLIGVIDSVLRAINFIRHIMSL